MKVNFYFNGIGLPVEPTELHDGLKWSYRDRHDRRRKIHVEFRSEFRVIPRDEWGDSDQGGNPNYFYDVFDSFDDALREYENQKRFVDSGELPSTEIEVVLRWDDADGMVDWEEIEIYHYGEREYRDPHAE